MLTAIDADLKLDAYRLEAGPVRAGPVKLGIRLNEGLLDVQIERAAFAGGTINGSLSLNGVSRVPGFQVTINADALSMKELAPLTGLVKLDAPFTGGATLTASGKSAEELTGTLKGAAAFTMGAGRIEGFDVASLLARLGNEIVPGWPGSGSTPFNALAADFEIEDGIAAMRSFALSGNDFTVTGSGDIDLLRRALDLKFEPKLGTGEAAAPVFPVKLIVEGPWAAPRFYPDIAGILQNPAAGFATLRNMRQAGN
jgi:AsmA protein